MKINKEIEISVSDAIIQKTTRFTVGKQTFNLYPSTLGRMQILKSLYLNLEINTKLLAMNPIVEALRVCEEKREEVCRIVAYSTLNDKYSIMNVDLVAKRTAFFRKKLAMEELASLLTAVLSADKVEEFIRYFGIDADRKLKTEISRVKGEGHSVTFGGKSIYGLLIDFACQRYGWTMDYVLWGISYVNLSLLMADAITTVYLSDDERKKLNRGDGVVIDADDPANRELVRRMIGE